VGSEDEEVSPQVEEPAAMPSTGPPALQVIEDVGPAGLSGEPAGERDPDETESSRAGVPGQGIDHGPELGGTNWVRNPMSGPPLRLLVLHDDPEVRPPHLVLGEVMVIGGGS
jgi:hypothetical protein